MRKVAFRYGRNLNNPLQSPENLFPPIARGEDGVYRVYEIEYQGDSRGNGWYQTLTCLAVDRSTGQPTDVPQQGTVTLGQPQVIGQ